MLGVGVGEGGGMSLGDLHLWGLEEVYIPAAATPREATLSWRRTFPRVGYQITETFEATAVPEIMVFLQRSTMER
jgi:hypothetical protein